MPSLWSIRLTGDVLDAPGSPRCTHSVKVGDLFRGQLRFGRHLVGLAVVDGVDQQAILGVAGNDGRAGRAAGQDGRPRVEPQAALLLVGAVTSLAPRREDRPDFLLEELDVRRVGFAGKGGAGIRAARGASGLAAPATLMSSSSAVPPLGNEKPATTTRMTAGQTVLRCNRFDGRRIRGIQTVPSRWTDFVHLFYNHLILPREEVGNEAFSRAIDERCRDARRRAGIA